MANIRNLKKDIDYLVDELTLDCFLYLRFNANKHYEKIEEILNKAVDLRNSLFDRVNNPDGKHDAKLVKKHYQSIRKELLAGIHDLFEQISRLPK